MAVLLPARPPPARSANDRPGRPPRAQRRGATGRATRQGRRRVLAAPTAAGRAVDRTSLRQRLRHRRPPTPRARKTVHEHSRRTFAEEALADLYPADLAVSG